MSLTLWTLCLIVNNTTSLQLDAFHALASVGGRGAQPCAPTPLSHPVGEGLGVRAAKSTNAPHPTNLGDVPPATGSLWDDRAGSLYDDFKARRVGDLVTIVVVESTTASARANTAVQKSESASTTAGVGPLLNFLWPELSASGKTDSNTQGNTARAGTLQTRITVQVVETYPNGVLRIEGRRTLKINEETQTLVFSGLVRIRDIRADNTVPSTAIANAEIYFEGKGIVGSRQREGILTRLFKIIF
jgi:flagellar L-ring protein precursor FlgH